MSSVISERTFSNRRRSLNNRMAYHHHHQQHRAMGANRSVIGDGGADQNFLLPQFSAAASEGAAKLDMMDDRWGENTTVITGATSEHSYGGGGGAFDDEGVPFLQPPRQSLPNALFRRCSRLCWLCSVFVISFLALVSAPLMAALPHALAQLGLFDDGAAEWSKTQLGSCEVDCQGQLLNLSGKTALLFLALYVLFWRRSAADLPRLFLHRAAFAFFVFFVLFAFWLFYIVRIVLERNVHLPYILSFALSLLDILLFIHCVWIFFELRQIRPVYSVQVVRDPDGEWRTQELGQMSIQEATVCVLRLYRAHFPLYNPNQEQARSALGRFRLPMAQTGFKLYDIDGRGEGAVLPEVNARILMQAAFHRRMAGHSEAFRQECEWERRYRKLKCRLVNCTEEVFAQVKQMGGDGGGESGQKVEPMDPRTAAKTVLEAIARHLRKFLRLTGRNWLFRHDANLAHLQRCLAFGFSARTFLQRFLSSAAPLQELVPESKWSVLCDARVSGPLHHGLTFVLRCHDSEGPDRGVQLFCTLSAFPFLNLTEQQTPHKSTFQLKVHQADLGV